MTDVHPARVPADPAVATHQPTLIMAGVDQWLEPRTVRTRRRCIAALGRRVAERFVWALSIVALAEAIEAALLRREMRLRRARRRGFEGLVHPLVPAILLGMRGLDQLGPNAESHPPHRERRQSAQRIGGKRLPVVRADPLGEAVAPEYALEGRPAAFGGGPEQAAAAEQEPRRAILHGERVTVHAVRSAELALEIGGPDRVGLLHRRAGGAPSHPAPAAAP